ncbi:xanthine dehydrogenase family protein molybdopterin-binding subunit [Methylovirgula sp. HY1]|uniref:xanthine dehydrogenase family protein molybdopterin-binding subunit n=1 Tax=Methylovirgula sp. HY1 TaxID=2822761 RepID=UPI001C5A8399|nr:xanthine dehydrogenase family protein molybdopterin-binding subunit [Methylovirgula sp. HY1]QXX76717.1 Isoquinoline 1-oxidoreductase subunit beta [Methylovirgula sp. HY1]
MTRRDSVIRLIDPAALAPLSRRQLVTSCGGFLLSFAASPLAAKAHAKSQGEEPSLKKIQSETTPGSHKGYDGFKPAGFIRISKPDGIVLIIPNVEMGQEVYTAEAMLIAEELEVGLDQLRVIPAPPNEDLYTQPILKSQSTGGSTSVRGAWVPLRQAGAVARTMLIGAAAAQWNVPTSECFAKRAVVTHRPTGRTLAYPDLGEAAFRQPVPKQITLKSPDQFELIGKPLPRIEGPSKVNGTAQFGIDVAPPGMKIGTVMACPTLGGRLIDFDDRSARAIPGVRDVVRLADAVCVIGDHFWAAQQGLRALRIRWDDGPNRDLTTEILENALKAASEHGKPVLARNQGDVSGAFERATKKLEAVYQLPFLAHATMEPINVTVHVRPDACEVWVGTQVPTRAQNIAAKMSGLRPDKVIVHNYLIGGGFGRRLTAEYVGQAVAIAKQVSYPVKIIWTRQEDIHQDLYRPAYYDRISAATGPDGLPIAWIDHITGGSVMGRYLPQGLAQGQLDTDAVEGAAELPYDLPAIHVDWVRADPPIPISWWRGVGPTHNVFVVESFMDELAHAAGRDPVEYRLALLKQDPRAANVLKIAAEMADWGKPLPQGAGRGIALHNSFASYVASVVEISVAPTGEIALKRIVGVIDCGQCVNPDGIQAQMEGGMIFGLTAALFNKITLRNGRVEQNNFNDYRMMRMNDTPPVEVRVVTSREAPGGVGETGTVAAMPALGNAIFAATGKRLRRYPFDTNALQNPHADRTTLSQSVPVAPAPKEELADSPSLFLRAGL